MVAGIVPLQGESPSHKGMKTMTSKRIIGMLTGLAIIAAVAAPLASPNEAKAEPVTITTGAAIVVVGTAAILVAGVIAATATARRNGCGWVKMTNQNGVTDSVYVCGRG